MVSFNETRVEKVSVFSFISYIGISYYFYSSVGLKFRIKWEKFDFSKEFHLCTFRQGLLVSPKGQREKKGRNEKSLRKMYPSRLVFQISNFITKKSWLEKFLNLKSFSISFRKYFCQRRRHRWMEKSYFSEMSWQRLRGNSLSTFNKESEKLSNHFHSIARCVVRQKSEQKILFTKQIFFFAARRFSGYIYHTYSCIRV